MSANIPVGLFEVCVATTQALDVAAIVSLTVAGERFPANLCQNPSVPVVGAVEVRFLDESVYTAEEVLRLGILTVEAVAEPSVKAVVAPPPKVMLVGVPKAVKVVAVVFKV